ncbi:MAG: DMT family transporter [Fusobacteriaceae bacterium]
MSSSSKNNVKGALYMCLSALSFATMGALAKTSSSEFSGSQILFFRGIVSALFIYITATKSDFNFLGGNFENKKLLFYRSLLGTLGAICYFYAIKNMILADAVLLNNLSPIWVTCFAWWFLKEKPKKIQIILLITMLIGAVFIIKPQFNFSILPALIGFSSSIFAGAAYTFVRHISKEQKPSNIVFWFSLYSAVYMIPDLLIHGFVVPTLSQLVILFFVGITSGLGQLFLTHAYTIAMANSVSIFQYLNIVFAGLFGILFWKEMPDFYSFLGAGFIVVSGIISYQTNKK